MAKIVAKLFRDPRSADTALTELKKKGFKEGEIGILARPYIYKGNGAGAKVAFPGVGELVIHGPLKSPLSEAGSKPEKPALAATLAQVLGLPEETTTYFEFGVSIGGVLLTVHTADDKSMQARDILRLASVPLRPRLSIDHTPGFNQAGRMAATDPVDAPMSGDFRKY